MTGRRHFLNGNDRAHLNLHLHFLDKWHVALPLDRDVDMVVNVLDLRNLYRLLGSGNHGT